ncbi:hypothetical protein G5V58_22580 [Nocardioides anomalus]|uniref:Uncharacterized protein n=1 Tax=Nocardioides anomalus TaxID=2712223 RepID=A0A6G6WJ43_9ACTN|nr:hypothetical protein [Nocardioides anomalus]QIG45177.1 hypothetical protein G5V58_22580 [Nocardioides anomalus]
MRRALPVCLSALLLASALGSTSADGAASVVVGSTGPGTPFACSAPASGYLLTPLTSATASYTVPGAGVLTSVSYAAVPSGQFRVVLFGPGDTPTRRTVRAYTDVLTAAANTVTTVPVRIPVAPGTTIGLWLAPGAGMRCGTQTGNSADAFSGRTADPTATAAFDTAQGGSTFSVSTIPVSAVWEPDTDGDGYGDTSGDLCPQSAAYTSACPTPDTTLTKAPRLISTKRKAKVAFGSTIPGSTFTCAVDKKPAKPCASPLRQRYGYGRHTLRITAISPLGVADPAPLEVRFKIRKKKR